MGLAVFSTRRRRAMLTRRNLLLTVCLVVFGVVVFGNSPGAEYYHNVYNKGNDTPQQPTAPVSEVSGLERWHTTTEFFRMKKNDQTLISEEEDLGSDGVFVNKAKEVASAKDLETLPSSYSVTFRPAEFAELPRLGHSFDKHFWAGLDDTEIAKLKNKEYLYYYDPRLTLAVYLNYIRREFEMKNPENIRDRKVDALLKVPFHWTDWTDFTYLNEFIVRDESEKITCEELISRTNENKYAEGFCTNAQDITPEQLAGLKVNSVDALPGFVINKYIDERTNPEDMLVISKTYLLTNVDRPHRIMFQAKGGYYQVLVDKEEKVLESNMMDTYYFEHGISKDDEEIVFNVMEEFDKLVASVPPRFSEENALLPIFDPQSDYTLNLQPEMFEFDEAKVDKLLVECEAKLAQHSREIENLAKGQITEQDFYQRFFMPENEIHHCQSLRLSRNLEDKDLGKYFYEAKLSMPKPDSDNGHHYDFRFYSGGFSQQLDASFTAEAMQQRKKVILHRLIRNWLQFTFDQGIIQWIAHGSLLSWYWDGMVFPWDMDTDVQMPVAELDRFGKLYNQTLVVEDPRFGFGKYFVDCGTFVTHRVKGNGNNNIDARFIDVDSGTYIDITALALTNTKMPSRYKNYADRWRKQHGGDSVIPIYNCRNNHFYSFDEISPMKMTMMEGVPTTVPNKIKEMLVVEYKRGLSRTECEHFNFVEKLRIWVHENKIKSIVPNEAYEEEDGKFSTERFASWVNDLSDDQVLSLLDDSDISSEFLLTRKLTNFHRKEVENLHKTKGYTEHIAGVKLFEPLRKTLFDWLDLR